MTDQAQIKRDLMSAMNAKDGDAFELALGRALEAGLLNELGALLRDALLQSWHQRHKDVVRALQQIKDPHTATALFEAAQVEHEYLAYDEFFGLARKCTWALADIGTTEAKECLTKLARSPNRVIAGYAQKRLDSWDKELPRKGASGG